MQTTLISPTQDLIEEIVNQLGDNGKDYSSHLVVFPGKRPSHFLRKALAGKEKTGLIPPQIFSMDEFIDFVYEKLLGNIHKKLELLDAVAILHNIHIQAPIRFGGDNFLKPDLFFPLGFKLYRDLEELYIEGASPKAVREVDYIAGENIPQKTIEKLQLLSSFYESFYLRIKEGNYSTRSSRYRAVAEEDICKYFCGFNKIIFAGFFALTKSEQSLFKNLMGKDNTIFVFQDGIGLKENLAGLGISVENPPHIPLTLTLSPEGRGDTLGKGEGIIEPEIYFYKSPDTHGQVYGVSQILKEKIEANTFSAEKTVITVPLADTIFPLYNHTLPLLDPKNYNISLGYPLYRTPLFGFLNNLMQLVTSMDSHRLFVPDYLTFILHPYTKNIRFKDRADITRMLFHNIEEALTESRTKKFLELSEIENEEKVVEYIKEKILKIEPDLAFESLKQHLKTIHQKTIEKMVFFNNVEDFAKKTIEVLTYIYENSTAPLHPFFYPYLEAFITHLDIISRSLMKEVHFDKTGSYFALFKKYIMTCHTPFEGTPVRGLQVLGFLETRNLKFENVIFLDTNDDIIPGSKREDSILPYKARRILGLPTYIDREKIAAYYFETLIRGAREVHLFYIETNLKEKSRFVEKLCWEKQKKEKVRDAKAYIKVIQYSVKLKASPPRPIEKTDGITNFLKNFPFSASSLNTYLECPFKFYYRYVLDIKPRENESDKHEAMYIGNFVHDVLYEYFMNKRGRLLTEKDMDTRELEIIVHNLFEKRYGGDLLGDTYLLKRQIKKHLVDFIDGYQIPLIKKCSVEIIDLERPLDFTQNSYNFKAKLDRIEKRSGRITIIDYKTSGNKDYLKINFNKFDINTRDSWNEAIGSLQLPFYLMAYAEAEKEQAENIDCMFLLLGMTELNEKIEAPLFEKIEETKEKYNLLQTVIWELLKEITDPNHPFTLTTTPRDTCAGCDFKYICSIQ